MQSKGLDVTSTDCNPSHPAFISTGALSIVMAHVCLKSQAANTPSFVVLLFSPTTQHKLHRRNSITFTTASLTTVQSSIDRSHHEAQHCHLHCLIYRHSGPEWLLGRPVSRLPSHCEIQQFNLQWVCICSQPLCFYLTSNKDRPRSLPPRSCYRRSLSYRRDCPGSTKLLHDLLP